MIYHTPMHLSGGKKRVYHDTKDCPRLGDDVREQAEPVESWELCKYCAGTEQHTNGDDTLFKTVSDPEFTAEDLGL